MCLRFLSGICCVIYAGRYSSSLEDSSIFDKVSLRLLHETRLSMSLEVAYLLGLSYRCLLPAYPMLSKCAKVAPAFGYPVGVNRNGERNDENMDYRFDHMF